MIAWANVFGNQPVRYGPGANYAVRVVVTYVLGVVTYLGYYFVLSGAVLHEPVLTGQMHGDALGFVDWVVLWMLWYVIFFGSLGVPPMRADDAEPADHRVATES